MITADKVDILLVEDNEYDAELILRALRKQNLHKRVMHIEDGAEAYEFISATGKYQDRSAICLPKVILLDLKLPKMDGKEILQKIKSDERTKTIPTVILTSSTQDEDVNDCYKLGANSFISKPVDFNNFLQTVIQMGNYWLYLNREPASTF
ncbi:MAG: response regulator [Candidatus Saccharibacteria bacterium]